MSKPAKTWDLTLNNYTDVDIETFKSWSNEVKKMVISKECGEEETPHLQGRITFSRAYRLTGLKKLVPRAHWEVTMCASDSLYVMKEGSDVIINVNNKNQGHRSDLDEIKEKLDNGVSQKVIAQEHFGSWVRYNRSFEKYSLLVTPPRDFKTELHIIWGAPGSGKSHTAYEEAGEDVYTKMGSNKWWDGYTGQECVVIDDFYGGMPWTNLLNIADKYKTQVETKGGMVPFVAKKIFITSNQHPQLWYSAEGCEWGALERRITSIRRFDEKYVDAPHPRC